jgi:hypothetical protein
VAGILACNYFKIDLDKGEKALGWFINALVQIKMGIGLFAITHLLFKVIDLLLKVMDFLLKVADIQLYGPSRAEKNAICKT